MAFNDVLARFFTTIPVEYPKHMFCYFAANAAIGHVRPFVRGLVHALDRIDKAAPGYAAKVIDRMASIEGTGEAQYEALLEICTEVYVTSGAVQTADRGGDGRELFRREPALFGGKNPEFEVCSGGIWYAVEVKTPKLIEHSRIRQANPWQLTARLDRSALPHESQTLPRDNPVKDFLISADEKFSAYKSVRPEAFNILTIVWDDFCNEPITALLHPHSGLLTPNSFYVDDSGNPVLFPNVDAIVVCRYQHQLLRATREEPLIDSEAAPFVYYNYGFPPKALIENPLGRQIPDELLEPLNATRLADLQGAAEYNPCDLVMWVGEDEESHADPAATE